MSGMYGVYQPQPYQLIAKSPSPVGTVKFEDVTIQQDYAYVAGGQANNTLTIYDIRTEYGIGIRYDDVNSSRANVIFGKYMYASGSTYGSSGTNWNGSRYWRVKKCVAGQAVGFGQVSSTSAGLMPSTQSNFDDATATRLGYKVYSHGTNYNGGNAPTVTLSAGGGTLSTVNLADFIPYQTQDGNWRLRFVINVSLSTTTRTEADLAMNGITFPNIGTLSQAIAGYSNGTAANVQRSGAAPNTNTVSCVHASASTNEYDFSGDVKLSAKPSWAY